MKMKIATAAMKPMLPSTSTVSRQGITASKKAPAAGTLIFQLVSDAQAAIAVDGSATVHIATGSFVTDDAAANSVQLNAGGIIACIALPLEGPVYERFLGVLAITGTTTTTAGKINSFLTLDPSKWKATPDAVN